MCFISMRTSSSFSPARNVMSTTRPLLSSLSFVLTNAPPLPGFTCWKSTMIHILLSYMMHMPVLKLFVVTAMRFWPFLEFDKLTRSGGQHAHATFLDGDKVLDSNTAEACDIDTRLHGDYRARFQHVMALLAHGRHLMHIEADAVSKTVGEVLPQPVTVEHRSRHGVHVAPED